MSGRAHLAVRTALVQRAIGLDSKGWYQRDIAEELGVSLVTAHTYIHAGELIVRIGSWDDETVEHCLSLAEGTKVGDRNRVLAGLSGQRLRDRVFAWDDDMRAERQEARA